MQDKMDRSTIKEVYISDMQEVDTVRFEKQ